MTHTNQLKKLWLACLMACLFTGLAGTANAQVGPVLWQEDFTSIDPTVWGYDIGNGANGWGNAELEYYTNNNASIMAIPGEPGNTALVIEARQESQGGFAFTSSRLNSEDKLAVRYGMIEMRMKTPDVSGGLWPAFWMLGVEPSQWPQRGEIDIMEMGHSLHERERQGFPNADINNFTTSNIFLYSDAACAPGNLTCAGNALWDVNYAQPYVPANSLAERWVTYRLYWDEDAMRLTIVDNGTEHDLFAAPFGIAEGTDTEIFRSPFFFLANMAVGGSFTGLMGNNDITATLPGQLWIDYITVKEWNGQGEVYTGAITSPSVAITSPAEGAALEDNSSIALTADASAESGASIAKVAFYNGTTLIGIDSVAPYAVDWTNVPAGEYSVTAQATDSRGVRGSSTAVNVIVLDGSGVGQVLWQEDFSTLDRSIWQFNIGNGDWGWGNGELQFYKEDNASIQPVPGEPGNTALVIEARAESAGGFDYSSARLHSENGVAVKYGLIEVRMKTPDLNNGLWPAFWMMGTEEQSWPLRGEIDIMEMGHSQASRDREGHGSDPLNHFVGSNIILRSEGACSPENPTCAGSAAYDTAYAQPYVAPTSLAERWVTYRMYWSPASIRITIVDNGVEHDMFAAPFGLAAGTDTEVFRKPFFFLMNMAVGGNFTDIATAGGISAPMPAQLWIDEITVSEWNGHGSVSFGPNQGVVGKLGVFTEDSTVTQQQVPGVDMDIYVWDNTLEAGSLAPYEGNAAFSFKTTDKGWFGAGTESRNFLNMSNHANGSLNFAVNAPADLGFAVGFSTNGTNHLIDFPAGVAKYGLTRSGGWEQVSIPLKDFGWVDLQRVNYSFIFMSDGSPVAEGVEFAFDHVVWDDTPQPSLAPNLYLTNPGSGQEVADTDTVTLSANAFDIDGSIAQVEFYANDSLLHTATTAPYTFAWSGMAAGDYTLTAVAVDDTGMEGTSPSVSLTVSSNSGLGALLWQEDFASIDPNVWQFETGNGNWGWGNGELQFYKEDNASIKEIPGEPGNTALVITAKRESVGGYEFTSSRLKSQGKLAVQYGMVEVRMQTPDVSGGLWPAFWLLGSGTQGWPAIGEIDMMEMGHNQAERARQGHPDSDVNHYVGSNVIWRSEASCSPENPTCAASAAWDVNYDKPYEADSSLANRFVTYRMYWDPAAIRLTIVDNGVEYDMFESPFALGPETEAFRAPFYFLINMAVGGTFPDIFEASGISATLPGELWIDYITVNQWNGRGEIIQGSTADKKSGIFGVFTDRAVDSKVTPGLDADVYVWENTLAPGSEAPYHGGNVLAYQTTQENGWYGGGIATRNYLDLTDYAEGSLKFKVKMPASSGFKVGILYDGGESWITFGANETNPGSYRDGLARTGDWEAVSIPLSEFGNIDLSKVSYPFAILNEGPQPIINFAYDDIIYDPTPVNGLKPVATLVTPETGTVLAEASDVTLLATATDPDGTVTRVEFYEGPRLVGIATQAPYAVVWKNVQPGDYLLRAKAIDNRGNESWSNSATASVPVSGIGAVLWEDNFNSIDTSTWQFDIGNGNWGWGNGELEYYQQENASIEAIAGEPGNNALVIEARQEAVGNQQFTSARLKSKDGVAVRYGVIEARVKEPSVAGGLWPAVWMLGTNAGEWPHIGEIDIMEMGHNQHERSRQGHANADVDHYVGSNIIFYSDDAQSSANPTGAASASWDPAYAKPYVADSSLANRFVTYRLYWSSTNIKLSIIDNGVEHFMFEGPFYLTEDHEAFHTPFYFLLNLAVGGVFTDALSNEQVSAAMPAKMYVDYLRVSEWNGEGEVFTGPAATLAPEGVFGVFTETTATNGSITPGQDSDIFLWNNLAPGTEAPYEGNAVMGFQTQSANVWYGGGVHLRQFLNMSHYQGGSLQFMAKLPADVDFKVGITTESAEYWVNFPANTAAYGMQRTGEWEQVTIPMSDLGVSDLSKVNNLFAFATVATPTTQHQLAFDNVVWVSPNPPSTIATLNVGTPANQVAHMEGDSIALAALAYSSTNSVSLVEFYNGSTLLGTDASAPYTLTWANAPQGQHSLTVMVYDNQDTVSSAPVALSVVAGNAPVPDTASTDCQFEATNGDYTATVTNEANPTVTFAPDASIAGGSFVILSGWVDGNAIGAWYMTADGDHFTHTVNNLAEGSNFSFAFTYGLPQGGQRDNVGSPHNMAVGQCGGNGGGDTGDGGDGGDGGGGTPGPCSFSTTVEAEDYSMQAGVQTEGTADLGGGLNVGWIDANDWMVYDVALPPCTYTVSYRVASLNGGGQIQFEAAGGATVFGVTNVPSTGGWQNWTTITQEITITDSLTQFALSVPTGGYNLNWIEITPASTSSQSLANEGVNNSPLVRSNASVDNLKVYPNPTRGTLFIHHSGYAAYEALQLQVLDATGKTHYTQHTEADAQGELHTQLNGSAHGLLPGLYFLRIASQDHMETKRFIVVE